MAMTVIVVEAAPNRLRGWLNVWMLQVHTGVYVANLSQRVREFTWKYVHDHLDGGNAVIAWQTRSEVGYDFDTLGPRRRQPVDFDGLKLVQFLPVDDS